MRKGITEEDKDLVLESILIHLLIDVLERDAVALNQSKVKIKEPYLELLEKSLQRAFQERKDINNRKSKQGIKVFDGRSANEDFVEYRYIVRGYEGTMRLFRYALKNYTRDKLKDYLLHNT